MSLVLAGVLSTGTGVINASADGAVRLRFTERFQVSPGIEYRAFTVPAGGGIANGHVLIADLNDRRVRVGLLRPGAVAARDTVSRMADAQGAVAGVNGDFFDIKGATATGAAVGPAISEGVVLKAAAPRSQRMGPRLPRGASEEDVIGIGTDGVARLDRVSVTGSVNTAHGTLALRGFNQYAIPEGGVSAFTDQWGKASRYRAVCGPRAMGCGADTYEVTVRGGRVDSVSAQPGSGPIPHDTVVLVGREGGAQALRQLRVGDRVDVQHQQAGYPATTPPLTMAAEMVAQTGTAPTGLAQTLRQLAEHEQEALAQQLARVQPRPLRFAIGAVPILRGGRPLHDLDDRQSAVRAGAGYGAGGRRLYLLALDGSPQGHHGMTLTQFAHAMRELGADNGVDLDGGGSATLVARSPGSDRVTVRNHPADGTERLVPEGIGLFSQP
ncbi:phosphodiester glycosidase family protein [Streptantibioticus rubrisoli]|uniref:Phosphodiester glycosidase family protein n=1 Tax=Streptantibioticus rubrisoli TaxID=1387313 RepID=A0ABT1P754_9ACTN|nr:phosphodiester glycosidase family protein [Streptantibioticus rubrisoli]MCQ4041212.1 phosphodiester glycosidase family protein [Streptantibioticus rubrisoli]